MKLANQFLAILREKCAVRGTQRKLVKATGVSQASMSKIVSGEIKDPGLSVVSAIADELGLELCIAGSGSDCIGVRMELEREKARNKELELENERLKGEIAGIRSAFEYVAGKPQPAQEQQGKNCQEEQPMRRDAG